MLLGLVYLEYIGLVKYLFYKTISKKSFSYIHFVKGVYSRHIEASTGSVSSLLVYGCLNDCYGGGLCNSGVCLCEASGGYYGQYCQFSNCSNPCQNGGICVGINVCNCTNGYFGSYCQLCMQHLEYDLEFSDYYFF